MALAVISAPDLCPQCGASAARPGPANHEFCFRCGSPSAQSYSTLDPLRPRVYGGGIVRVNRRAKLVVRSGVLGIGLLSVMTGFVLLLSGWAQPAGMDVIQLWISRLAAPVLLAQGLAYLWLPFRQPAPAPVVQLARRRTLA